MSSKIKFLRVACAASAIAVAALWATAASALSVNFVTSSVTVNDASFSTGISYTSVGLNNTITLGTPLTISNFITGTVTGVNKTDQSGTISAVFSFTDPTSATGTDSGTVMGQFAGNSSNLKEIDITWADPITVTFTDGTKLSIDLANVAYNCPSPSCDANDSFNVSGTFTLLNGPTVSQTPLPGALPLLASGLGGMGFFLSRRNKKRAALAA